MMFKRSLKLLPAALIAASMLLAGCNIDAKKAMVTKNTELFNRFGFASVPNHCGHACTDRHPGDARKRFAHSGPRGNLKYGSSNRRKRCPDSETVNRFRMNLTNLTNLL